VMMETLILSYVAYVFCENMLLLLLFMLFCVLALLPGFYTAGAWFPFPVADC